MLRRGLVVVLLLLASLAFADTAKRLVLKDGSYQKVTKYEVQGDRVHYFSAERGVWEDVPKEMVDWSATKKYEQDEATAAAAAKAAKEKADEADNEVVSEQDARTPEVAPNLRLPQNGGVFILDQFGGSSQLVELTQSTSQTDEHSGSYILKHTVNPIASKTSTVELPGAHAKVQVHALRPVIYLNVDTEIDTEDIRDANKPLKRLADIRRPTSDAFRFQFVKLGEKRDLRVLETIKTSVMDESSYSQSVIHTVGQLTPGDVWIKIQPKEDLAPGEYAIEEMLAEDSSVNPYVWDFRINPAAPANPAALQAGQQKSPAANDEDTAKRMKD